jgi:hypothetical protein
VVLAIATAALVVPRNLAGKSSPGLKMQERTWGSIPADSPQSSFAKFG